LIARNRKNYPGIDAWIPGIGAFQITISMSHNLHHSVGSDLEKLGVKKLYWLLHPRNYENFTYHGNSRDIEQYAVLVPVDSWSLPIPESRYE
jgi:hypothetical protein